MKAKRRRALVISNTTNFIVYYIQYKRLIDFLNGRE